MSQLDRNHRGPTVTELTETLTQRTEALKELLKAEEHEIDKQSKGSK